MSDVSAWNTAAASNNSVSPNGFPENMQPSGVNDSAREVMAAVRRWYEDVEWRNWGHAATFASATTFTIETDVTAVYVANRPIRCTDATILYGYVVSSSYSAPNTTVTVALDSGSLSASLTAVALGPTPSTLSIPIQSVRYHGKSFLNEGIGPSYIQNLGLTASVSLKALTIALKTKALADASASDPIQIAFRSTTLTSGTYVVREITAAHSIVVTSGATLGFTAAEDGLIYVYECDDGTARQVGVIKKALPDESILHNTTAISATADSDSVLYTTTAMTNVAVRLIGRIRITTGAIAGEWDNAATRVDVGSIDPSSDHFSHPVLKSGTAIATTSGTSHDFTGIPPGVKQITLSLVGVSTNGTSVVIVQIGDSGGIETSSYLSSAAAIAGAGANSAQFTTGFATDMDGAATRIRHGTVTLVLHDPATNTWAMSGVIATSDTARVAFAGGSKSLTAILDRVRLTTVNGTDAYDAGSVNILYE